MKDSNIWIRKTLILLFWLIIWQTISLTIKNPIVFVGPFEMLRALWRLLPAVNFWLSIASSFGKISLGFLSAFILGILLGSASYHFSLLRELMEPVMILIKSIPVASFIILALIWIGSGYLSIFISFLVVFPAIYINTIAGLMSTDKKLLEMAQVFRIPFLKKLHFIYFPALMPYLISSCKTALGMSWKSGIAAEVIGVPAHSIGEHLYMAKIYLNTADLFAWTFVIIIISGMFERLFLLFLKTLAKKGGYHESSAS